MICEHFYIYIWKCSFRGISITPFWFPCFRFVWIGNLFCANFAKYLLNICGRESSPLSASRRCHSSLPTKFRSGGWTGSGTLVDQSDSRKLPFRPITSLQICVGAKLWLTLANGPDNPVPELTSATTPTALQRWQNSIVSLLSTASQQCEPSNSKPKPNKMKNRM